MSFQQLSLWDNQANEKGNHAMIRFDFEEALQNFKNALSERSSDQNLILQNVAACDFWSIRLTRLRGRSGYTPAEFWLDLQSFSFSKHQILFKESLLDLLIIEFPDELAANLTLTTSIFDELLVLNLSKKAGRFIESLIEKNATELRLRYLLAQAQWKCGNKNSANRNYANLLLHQPDMVLKNRIENRQILALINKFGAALAPAYCLLYDISPLNLNDEPRPINETHRMGIESLRCLIDCLQAAYSNDLKGSLQKRKKLNQVNPELYEAYFQMLKKN